jgi:hypothetical protein
MGMDLDGLNPRSKTGEHFRNSIWYWRPLWCYLQAEHSEHLPPDHNQGHYNDGFEVPATNCRSLFRSLTVSIIEGSLSDYAKAYEAHIASLPQLECPYCDGTGVRSDGIGKDLGFVDQPLDETTALIVGRTHGYCNACSGLGELPDPMSHYYFDEANILRFAEFVKDCGGFRVC